MLGLLFNIREEGHVYLGFEQEAAMPACWASQMQHANI